MKKGKRWKGRKREGGEKDKKKVSIGNGERDRNISEKEERIENVN